MVTSFIPALMLDVSGYLITTLLLTYLIHHYSPGQKEGIEFALCCRKTMHQASRNHKQNTSVICKLGLYPLEEETWKRVVNTNTFQH